MEGGFAYPGDPVACKAAARKIESLQDRRQGKVILSCHSLPQRDDAIPKSGFAKMPILLFVVRQFLALGAAPTADTLVTPSDC
jgi:hypothetical protein